MEEHLEFAEKELWGRVAVDYPEPPSGNKIKGKAGRCTVAPIRSSGVDRHPPIRRKCRI